MITAILDTNVLVQAAISPKGASFQVLTAVREGRFRLSFTQATLDELLRILMIPHIRARHAWSDEEVRAFVEMLAAHAEIFPGQFEVSPSVTRDVTDAKFLALAKDSSADYLVTQDRRHLLRLKRFHETRIVTPRQFLRELAERSG